MSTGAECVTLDHKINRLIVFGNPTNKTVTGTAYKWELLLANHLDQSLCSTNQKYRAAVRSNLLLSFFGGAQPCCTFHHPRQAAQICAEKPISWAKPAYLDCLESHTEYRWRCSKAFASQAESTGPFFSFVFWGHSAAFIFLRTGTFFLKKPANLAGGLLTWE
jgi:hypothetical protein